ncbi:MAG TPA: pyridoxal phosphate-dependent aminotransferase [Pirellulales bacterium]|jgi:aspartate aminotransferase|nr:pyridoxal phosphate-dependent aminotransferase [Pirellulales bacterium]
MAAISKIVQGIEPSATLAMAAKARELKAAGRTIYDFSLGEPDFNTPEHICQAAIEAMRSGRTHYTAASGIPELKTAVVRQYAERHGLEFNPQQVVVSNGAKHALHNAFTALLNPGDEVVIPAPYWVSYADLVKLPGGLPKIVPTRQDNDFKLTPQQLRQAITPKTRMLLLCSPSNPTGSMYSRDELAELADVAIEKDLVVVTDEIYERLVYGQHKFAAFATLRPGLADRTVTVNGVSKAYAMTGWRIGWTIAPPAVAKAIDNLQSQETSCPSSVSQYAAVAALTGPQQCVDQMLEQFAARREFVRRRLAEMPNLSCPEMGGAFYAFINIQAHLGRSYNGAQVNTSSQWCLELLAQQGVATVQGSAFGTEGYARLSYATSMQNLEAGLAGIDAFVRSAR